MFNTEKVKVSDVLEVEAALRSLIRNKYPDINVERGSTLNDLLVVSLGYLAAAVKSDTDAIKERLYLADLVSADTAESYAMLEDLASNFVVSSSEAPPKRGIVTFTFSSNISRTLPAALLLSRAENFVTVKLFDTTEDLVLSTNDYSAVEIDGLTRYQFSTLMESVSVADSVTISPGRFNSSVPLVDLVSIENSAPFVGASISEFSNRSLVSKIQYAQTLRTFSTRAGTEALILDEGIPNIKRVLAIGSNDPEMYRDVVPSTLSSTRFHSLGMANIVIASQLTENTISVDPSSLSIGSAPICGLSTVNFGSNAGSIISDFGDHRYIKFTDPATGKTTIEHFSIEPDQAIPSNSVRVSLANSDHVFLNGSDATDKFILETLPGNDSPTHARCWVDNNLPVVQGLVNSDRYRVVATNTMALAANLVQVLLPSITVSLPSSVPTSSLNLTRVKNTVASFINSWDQAYPLSVSSLVSQLALVFGGLAAMFSLPQGVQYILYLPDGRLIGYQSEDNLSVEEATKQLSPNSVSYQDILLPQQVSNRTLNYFVSPDDITVVVVNV